jgi:hypothetical protein
MQSAHRQMATDRFGCRSSGGLTAKTMMHTGLSSGEIQTMKCEKLLALLNDYIDGDVQPGICAELEQHLASCNPCHVVVDTVKKTITLYKAGQPYELPPGFRDRLHAELRARWKQSTPASPSENKG